MNISAPDLSNFITAWRLWKILPRTTQIEGVSGGDIWEPRKIMEAYCHQKGGLSLYPDIAAPHEVCTCGIYAAKSPEDLKAATGGFHHSCIIGKVALWGRVIEHEIGWKAQYAYPLSFDDYSAPYSPPFGGRFPAIDDKSYYTPERLEHLRDLFGLIK